MARHLRIIVNSRVILLEVALAAQIGLNEAIVLGHLYWRVTTYEDDRCEDKRHDNDYWFQGTYLEMVREHFPFLSAKTLQRTLDNLESKDLVRVRRPPQGSKVGNWYTINRDHVGALAHATGTRKRGASLDKMTTGQNDQAGQIDQCSLDKMTSEAQSDTGQIDQCSLDNLSSEPFSLSALNLHADSAETHAAGRDTAADAAAGYASRSEFDDTIAAMLEAGIDSEMAESLANAPTADLGNIRHQVAAMAFHNTRGLTNPTGYLVTSIRKKRELPPAYRKHLAGQAEAARRREQAGRERAVEAVRLQAAQRVQEEEEARLSLMEADLNIQERAELVAAARGKLSNIMRDKWDAAQGAGKEMQPAVEAEWRRRWREVLTERLDGPESVRGSGERRRS